MALPGILGRLIGRRKQPPQPEAQKPKAVAVAKKKPVKKAS